MTHISGMLPSSAPATLPPSAMHCQNLKTHIKQHKYNTNTMFTQRNEHQEEILVINPIPKMRLLPTAQLSCSGWKRLARNLWQLNHRQEPGRAWGIWEPVSDAPCGRKPIYSWLDIEICLVVILHPKHIDWLISSPMSPQVFVKIKNVYPPARNVWKSKISTSPIISTSQLYIVTRVSRP